MKFHFQTSQQLFKLPYGYLLIYFFNFRQLYPARRKRNHLREFERKLLGTGNRASVLISPRLFQKLISPTDNSGLSQTVASAMAASAIETFIRSAISAKFCFRNIASIWSEDNLICRAGTDTPIKEKKTMSSKRIINIVFCGQK